MAFHPDAQDVPTWYIHATAGACSLLFLASCMAPGACGGASMGWFHLTAMASIYAVHWLANPIGLMALALFCRRRFRHAALWGLSASVSAVSFLFSAKAHQLSTGYYLWLFAPVLLTASATIADRFGAAFSIWNQAQRGAHPGVRA